MNDFSYNLFDTYEELFIFRRCTMENEQEESIFNREFRIKVARIIIGLVLALVGNFWLTETRFGLAVNLTVMLIAWLILAYDVMIEAFEDIIKEHEFFNEELLMIIASIGAFALRSFGPSFNESFEGVMVMLLFQIGEMFEDIADSKSHKAIVNAVGLRAVNAHLMDQGKTTDIEPEKLQIGDVVLVRVGEILPADGIIIQGEGYLDMSSLTGESVPVRKREGESVNAGTILKEGSIQVKVSKGYEDNTVSKILNLIEESAESKSKATRFIDRFSRIYTPAVVLLALLLCLLPPLIINYKDPLVWQDWIYRSLNLLIISCPCAIVISVPLTYFAGIGLASKNGIIVKGGGVFDSLSSLGKLVTDKTGTLTYGNFKVTDIHTKMDEEEFLSYFKAAESRSNHPLAIAIENDLRGHFEEKNIEAYDEIAGHGIALTMKGKKILVGNEKLLKDNRIDYTPSEEVGSVIYLAIDSCYMGYLVCSDEIRPQSKELVNELHKKNIQVTMLTGDKKTIAMKTAKELSLDSFHAELLPDDKTRLLKEEMKDSRKKVAYMGDGINDAASIAMSDVGIAMGGCGSDLAIDNADLVIMNDNPMRLSLGIRIADLVRKHVVFNIAFSLFVKLLIIILASTIKGFPLMVSVIADTGLTMLLIVLSLLMLKHKFR